MDQIALKIEDLSVEFRTDHGSLRAVDQLSYELKRGEILGVVGESGSGKSVSHLAVLGLLPKENAKIVSGKIWLGDRDLLATSHDELRAIRTKRIGMIFQDPMSALNPFMTVGDQLTEVTQLHLGHNAREARAYAAQMLERVGIPAASRRLDDFPHQFSGGMRQRVMIAIALSCKPEILIADEPTTALDVTIQAQILDLIRDLQKNEGMSVIFITHSLGVVAGLCQRVLVMYAGRVVEQAPVEELFQRPRHPYTMGLLASYPHGGQGRLNAIEGQPPDMNQKPSGCAFHPRCPRRLERCSQAIPLLETHNEQRFACFSPVPVEA